MVVHIETVYVGRDWSQRYEKREGERETEWKETNGSIHNDVMEGKEERR